jgi:protein-disulfide isomerase
MSIWQTIRSIAITMAIALVTLSGPLPAAGQDPAVQDLSDLQVQNASPVKTNDDTPEASHEASPAPVSELTGYLVGDPEAPVTLQIYADYQCPHCRSFFNDIEPQLIDDYVRTGQVRLELLDFTVVGVPALDALPDDSLESVQAAEAAMCAAEQDGFIEYYQTLFTGEMRPNSGAFSDDNLKAFASDLGLDTDQFDDCLDTGKYEDAIIAFVHQGVERGVPGTPTLSINGGEVFSVGDYSDLQEIIETEAGT